MSQHGTGREYVADIVANVEAALTAYRRTSGAPVGDLSAALRHAHEVLTDDDFELDTPGQYGPDHCSDAGLDADDRWSGTAVGHGLGVSAVSERMTGRIEQ